MYAVFLCTFQTWEIILPDLVLGGSLLVVIYEAFGLDVAQGHIKVPPQWDSNSLM